MGILRSLEQGEFGVRLKFPDSFSVAEDAQNAKLIDSDRGIEWHVFFFPDLDFAIEDTDQSLRADAEVHARFLFQTMQGDPPAHRPPLISCRQVQISGAPAAEILHRMALQPGREIIMGHLLLPLKKGLFELRWLTASNSTGVRESILFDRALQARANPGRPPQDPVFEEVAESPSGLRLGLLQAASTPTPDEIKQLMSSTDFDDPAHDPLFPDHPLTRARQGAHWVEKDAAISVLDRAAPYTRQECEIPEVGCVVVPPPRFVRVRSPGVAFRRVSIAGTDSIEHLLIERRQVRDLASFLRDFCGDQYRSTGVTNVQVERVEVTEPSVCFVAEGNGNTGPLRLVTLGFMGDREWAWICQIVGPRAQPIERLRQELEGVQRRLRPTREPAAKRPWWRLF